MVDKEVSHLLTKKEAEEQLASLQQRKSALHAERDDKQQQRSQLELQLLRFAGYPHNSAKLNNSRSATQQSREEEQMQGQGQSSTAPGTATARLSSSCSAGTEAPQPPEQQAESHGLSHQQHPHAELDSCSEHEQHIMQEEELQRQAAALDDAVDTSQAQLRYLDSSMAECKTVSVKALPWFSDKTLSYTLQSDRHGFSILCSIHMMKKTSCLPKSCTAV